MTKPALMTFSNIKAINFYFNAKLTDFAMFSYQFNIWLTYCTMYRDYYIFEHFYLLEHLTGCYISVPAGSRYRRLKLSDSAYQLHDCILTHNVILHL